MAGTAISWAETWNMAVEALRANKVRAALTMLGVVIGSACIVLVVTVALTGKKYIAAQIEAVGSNIVYASLEHTTGSQTMALGDEISPAGDQQAPNLLKLGCHADQSNGPGLAVRNDRHLNVICARNANRLRHAVADRFQVGG